MCACLLACLLVCLCVCLFERVCIYYKNTIRMFTALCHTVTIQWLELNLFGFRRHSKDKDSLETSLHQRAKCTFQLVHSISAMKN